MVGSHVFIESYLSHRCAHQFGLDQDGVGWCYTYFFRLGTGARCQMVSAYRTPTFSRYYQQWYYDAIRSYQSYTPFMVVWSTCPRDGQVSLGGIVSFDHRLFPNITVEPVDF
jgi:hypothetical protein